MKRVYIVDCKMFGIDICLYIGTYRQAETYLRRKGLNINMSKHSGKGVTYLFKNPETGDCFNFIRISDFDDSIESYSLLCHECLHASVNTLAECNIPIAYDNDETMAYLQGFYFEQLLILLREELSKKIKGKSCKKSK